MGGCAIYPACWFFAMPWLHCLGFRVERCNSSCTGYIWYLFPFKIPRAAMLFCLKCTAFVCVLFVVSSMKICSRSLCLCAILLGFRCILGCTILPNLSSLFLYRDFFTGFLVDRAVYFSPVWILKSAISMVFIVHFCSQMLQLLFSLNFPLLYRVNFLSNLFVNTSATSMESSWRSSVLSSCALARSVKLSCLSIVFSTNLCFLVSRGYGLYLFMSYTLKNSLKIRFEVCPGALCRCQVDLVVLLVLVIEYVSLHFLGLCFWFHVFSAEQARFVESIQSAKTEFNFGTCSGEMKSDKVEVVHLLAIQHICIDYMHSDIKNVAF